MTARILAYYGRLVQVEATVAVISRTWRSRPKEAEVRYAFNVELKVDILSTDDANKAAFVELTTNIARMIYGQAAMLARKAPEMTATYIGPEGKVNIDLFEGAEFNSEE